jgi:ferric-dicitrate binding protein FerR (iron transport regulator)
MIQNRAYILLTRKLNGEANESEISELNILLEQELEFNNVASRISAHWTNQQDSDEEFMEATYLLHLERMKEKGTEIIHHDNLLEETIAEPEMSRRKGKRILAWAIPAILIIAAGAWFFTRKDQVKPVGLAINGNSQISTRNGSRTKIELPDGSSVWLNAGSKLEYDKSFGNELREVHLTGEAYFDVVRNPDKPFIVNTKAAKVKVLGTAFNVRCYPEDNKIETSLIHGSVEVTLNKRPEEKWILKPNEKLVLLNDYVAPQLRERVAETKRASEPVIAIKKLTYLPSEKNSVETAWTFNILSFRDENFSEVSKKMARWYDVEFVFKKKELEDMMLYGSFTTETIDEAMEALQYSFKFRYSIKDKVVTIY